MPKDKTSKLAGLSSLYPANAERQAEQLWIPTFQRFGLTQQGNRTQVYQLRDGCSDLGK